MSDETIQGDNEPKQHRVGERHAEIDPASPDAPILGPDGMIVPDSSKALGFVGCLAILPTIVVIFASYVGLLFWVLPLVPMEWTKKIGPGPGWRDAPIAAFLPVIPAIVIGLIFFYFFAALLEKLGLKVFRATPAEAVGNSPITEEKRPITETNLLER